MPMSPPSSLVMPVPGVQDPFAHIDVLDRLVTAEASGFGHALRLARQAAIDLRREFLSTGCPDSVRTYDLIGLPYPARFGLWRAALTPAPFVTITNRMIVVRWTDTDGGRRTLLFEPSDAELDQNTPYFARLQRRAGVLRSLAVTDYATVPERLREAGIDPADVDYLVFDHLHTQDVRRWLGTTAPQVDISPGKPVEGFFPSARLIVQRSELAAMSDLHPLQQPWYQPQTFVDLPPDRIVPIEGSVVLGPGVALVATPGHVLGNQTLLLNTDTGIWASSENAIAAECLTPELSKIPGVARWARTWDQEVILNANTLETTAQQYNSMVLEKSLVDPSQKDERFPQFFPSSELTRHWTNPGTAPTFTHGAIRHGSQDAGGPQGRK